MVSKPTGRPRGRPRKERPPRRPKAGRPPLRFRDDPDRYAVALLDALLALDMGSEYACSMGVAAWLVGLDGDPARVRSDGLTSTNWWRRRTRGGVSAGTLQGKAATLKQKRRRCRSLGEAAWRRAMAACFMLTIGARNPETAKPAILDRAASVGEREFAERVMLPMVAAKFTSKSLLPEFIGDFAST
jgi:hypothetical protein